MQGKPEEVLQIKGEGKKHDSWMHYVILESWVLDRGGKIPRKVLKGPLMKCEYELGIRDWCHINVKWIDNYDVI